MDFGTFESGFTYKNVRRNFDQEILSDFQITIPRHSATMLFIEIHELWDCIAEIA